MKNLCNRKRPRIVRLGGEGNLHGFTLVELLVVIAIIGVLIALLLPAVQAAREAARRMQCSNQVKQLSLAVHNYHDVNFNLPAGGSPWKSGTGANPSNARYSVFFTILPYMEQQPLYDAYVAAVQSTVGAVYTWTNTATATPSAAFTSTRHTQINTYLCPSDQTRKAAAASDGLVSYAACAGDWTDAGGVTAASSTKNPRGTFAMGPIWRGLESLSDGTSNTAIFSEKAIGFSNNRNVKGGIGYVSAAPFTASPDASTNTSISACASEQAGREYASASTDVTGSTRVGVHWIDGTMVRSGFCTILPPNSISCGAMGTDATDTGVREHSRALATASSYHPGGVQVGLGDGSVRFVSETIDATRTQNYCVTTGVSPFGVWGALGSIDGGESKSP